MTSKCEYTSKAGLLEHGWTDSAIRKFLGAPDKLAKNPHYRSGPRMQLYRCDRALAAMESDEWKEWHLKSLPRRAKASEQMKTIAANKRLELIEAAIDALETYFPEVKPSVEEVIDHWARLARNQEKERPSYPDEEALARWTENLLRHEYSNYDRICWSLSGEIGHEDAYQALRKAIDQKVGAYISSNHMTT